VDTTVALEAAAPVAATPPLSADVAEDRRRSRRVTQRMPAWISGESGDRGDRGHTVTVGDLSMHGVGFHDPAEARYRAGATHWLVVSGGAMRLSTRVRIVTCRPNPAGGHDVGAVFF